MRRYKKAGALARSSKEQKNVVLTIGATAEDWKDEARVFAREFLKPSTLAGLSLTKLSGDLDGVDLNPGALAETLASEADAALNGGMQRVESMLVAQAHTLDSLFHRMLRNGWSSQWVDHFRMALRAQAQCARTIEVLAAVKYPQSPQFIRQQNVAAVQQVNNGAAPATARAGEEKLISPNQLLEGKDAQRLDAGPASATVGADPQLETVGEIHRPANADGEGAHVEERLQGRQAPDVAHLGAGAAGAAAQRRKHRARPRVRQESREGA